MAVMVAALLAGAPASAEVAAGFVQFKAAPGVRIELDGDDVGTVQQEEGLVVRDVRPGARRFKATREGYAPQFGVVLVESDAITVERLDAWQPLTTAEPETPPEGFGTLVVDTLPVDATILARRLGWKEKVHKGDGSFIAREIPAGRHRFTFCNDTKCMDYWVKIPKNGYRKLLIDFEPGEIMDVTHELVSQWRAATRACSRTGDREACKVACTSDSRLAPRRHSAACDALDPSPVPAPRVAEAFRPSHVQASATFAPPDTCGIERGEPGFVSIASRHAVRIFVGAEEIGTTPIVRQRLEPGCHQVTAVTLDGREHNLTLRVEPGRTRKIKLTF